MTNIILTLALIILFIYLRGIIRGRNSDKRISGVLISKYGYHPSHANQLWFKYNNEVIKWEIDGLSPEEIALNIVSKEKG